MVRKKTIKVPIYFGTLTIHQTDDYSGTLDKYEVDGSKIADSCSWVYPKMHYHMMFRQKKHVCASYIAHECLHVSNYIFQNAGIRLNTDNDEPSAYLVAWLVKKCHLFLDVGKEGGR